jgi:hypothetical protein
MIALALAKSRTKPSGPMTSMPIRRPAFKSSTRCPLPNLYLGFMLKGLFQGGDPLMEGLLVLLESGMRVFQPLNPRTIALDMLLYSFHVRGRPFL